MEMLSGARLVCVGETHDNLSDKRVELEVIKGLYRRFPGKVAIGMEMFREPQQAVLDQWVKGELTELEFLKESKWYQSWGYDFSAYRDILLFARENRIDVIATDHAPHAVEEKESEFDLAPPGTIGLETALAAVLTHLVDPGTLSLPRAIEAMSVAPARILGAAGHGRAIEVGGPANLVVFDPAERWLVEPPFASKARNSAFTGHELTGRIRHTMLRGQLTVADGKVRD